MSASRSRPRQPSAQATQTAPIAAQMNSGTGACGQGVGVTLPSSFLSCPGSFFSARGTPAQHCRPCTVRPTTAATTCLTANPSNPCPWRARPGSPPQVGSVGFSDEPLTAPNERHPKFSIFHASKTLPPFDSFTPSHSPGTRRGPHDASARGPRGCSPWATIGSLEPRPATAGRRQQHTLSISIVTVMALLWRDRELLVSCFSLPERAAPRCPFPGSGLCSSSVISRNPRFHILLLYVCSPLRHRGYDSVLPGGKTGIAARGGRPGGEMNVVKEPGMTQHWVGISFQSTSLGPQRVRIALCHVRLAGASEHKSRHWAV